MINLTKENFDREVMESEKPVIVDFWSEWCGPCKELAPVFEKVSSEFKNMKFAKIDHSKNQKIAEKYNVRAIPCLIIFNKGNEIGRIVGSLKEDNLKAEINKILNN